MDPFALHKVAGHRDMKTTMRYVHPSDEHIREVIERIQEGQGGHTSSHTSNTPTTAEVEIPVKKQKKKELWSHPPGLNRRPADYESGRWPSPG